MNYLTHPLNRGVALGLTLPWNQSLLVKSRILDFDTQEPIENVTIQLESDTTVGVITNKNGFFEIYAAPKDNLIIRHLTYETYKVPISEIQQTEFLVPKIGQLEEVDLGIIKKRKQNIALTIGIGILFALALPFFKK